MKNLMRKGMILSIGILIAGLICDASFSPPLLAAENVLTDYMRVKKGSLTVTSGEVGIDQGTTNLYTNPDLETGTTTGWSFDAKTNGTLDAYSTDKLSGSYCARIKNSTLDSIAFWENMSVTSGVTYTMSCYAKNIDCPTTPYFTSAGVAVTTVSGGGSFTGISTTGWTRYYWTFTANATGALSAYIRTSENTTQGYFLLDDLQFEQKSAPTPFTKGTRADGDMFAGGKLTAGGMIESKSGGYKFPDGSIQASALVSGGWTKSGTSVYVTSTSDNVGIGTATPGAYKLNVQGGDVNLSGSVLWSGGGSANANTAYNHTLATTNVHGLTYTAEGSGGGLDADMVDGTQLDNIIYGSYKGTFVSTVSDYNTMDRTGFYTGTGVTNRPSGTTWTYLQNIRLYGNDNLYHKQIAFDTYNNNMWTRTNSGGSWSPWYKMWNEYNDGSGSGLDADTLDGHDTAYFQTALTYPVTGTGTPNKIAKFATASTIGDSLIFDNGTNVGIATVTPGQKLDVNGSINVAAGQKYKINNVDLAAADVGAEPAFNNGNLTAGSSKITIGGTGTGALVGAGASVDVSEANLTLNNIGGTLGVSKGGTGAGTFSANYLLKGNTTSPVSSSIVYENGTNVGIGTTSPGAKLDIWGTLSAGDSKFYNSVQLTSSYNGTTQSWIWSGAANQLNLGIGGVSAGNTKMMISSNGNVGIGTTSPIAKLDVAGEISYVGGRSDNLVQDPQFTQGTTWWTVAPTSVDISDLPDGTKVRAMNVTTSGNVSVNMTNKIKIDPKKNYRFTLWIKSDNASVGSRYIGVTALDAANANVGVYTSGGVSNTNAYFWNGDVPVANQWYKYVGYIFSSDTPNGWTNPPDTSSSNFRWAPTVAKAEIRFLNYYNEGTIVVNWFALPTIEEVNVEEKTYASSNNLIMGIGQNVGIGVTNPGQKLQVAGIVESTTGGFKYPDGSIQTSALSSGGWTKSGSNVYVTTTTDNVGIGTTAPGAKLEAYQGMSNYSTAFTSPHLNLGASNTVDNTGFVGITYDASTTADYGWSSGALRSTNGQSSFVWKYHAASAEGTERMRINEIGNVGIGTTAPGVKLDVNGDIRTNSNLYINSLRLTSSGSSYFKNYSGTNTEGGFQLYRNDGNLWGYFYADSAGIGILNGLGQWAILANGSAAATNTQVSFYTDGGTRRAFIDSSGLNFIAANPYINSSSYVVMPGGLYVSGGTLYATNQIQARGGIHNDSAATLDIAGGTGGYTNFSAGNVGIGIATPTYRLQIGTTGSLADSIRIGSYAVANNTRQYIGYARADTGLFESAGDGDTPSTVKAGVAGIRIVNSVGTVTPASADNSVQLLTHIYNGGSRVALHASYNGNVGIGTVTPGQKLQVAGMIESTTGGFKYPDGSTQASANSAGGWTKSGGNIYTSTLTDNIGIGTSSPASRLHIRGTSIDRTSVTDLLALGAESTGGAPYAGHGQGITFYDRTYASSTQKVLSRIYSVINDHSGSTAGTDLVFQTMTNTADASPSSKMIIRYDGNVGIGTTSPGSYKLNVAGPGYFSGAVTATQFNGSGAGLTNIPAAGLTPGNYSSIITSGTYNISITGNAATATNMSWSGLTSVPGYDSKTFAGNWGQHDNHGVYTDFNSVNQWGATFVQANTNGPTWNAGYQNYQEYHALGANYGPTTYGLQTTIARNPGGDIANPYLSVRYKENSVWTPWHKIAAGFADAANYLNTTGLYYQGGNVGIGTTSPGYKLDVQGTGRFTGAVTAPSVNVGSGYYQWSNVQYMWTNAPRITAPNSMTLYDQYSSNGGAGNPTTYGTLLDIYGRSGHMDSQLYFGSSGELLYRHAFYSQTTWPAWQTIITSANIGSQTVSNAGLLDGYDTSTAGTASTIALRDGNGDLTVRYLNFSSGTSITTDGTNRINLNAAGYTYIPSGVFYVAGMSHLRGGIDTDTAAYLQINGGTSGYTYFNGNVGIGTTSPATKLHITGDNAIIRLTGGTYTAAEIVDGGTGDPGYVKVFYNGSQDAQIGAGGTYLAATTGNVGIGTTSPTQKLEVNGAIRIKAGNYLSLLDAAGAERGYLQASGGLIMSTSGGEPTYFKDGGLSGDINMTILGSTGNVGIGTASPGQKLDVNGASRLLYHPELGPNSNNPEKGRWSALWTSIGAGKSLYDDEEFASGTNSVSVYNNSGGDGVVITRVADAGAPNTSGYVLQITNNGAATSPGWGGFIQTISSRRNTTFAQRFRAKLDVGRYLNIAENSQGSGATSYWLTSTEGTGKWEEYIRISHCGNTGTFSSGGHVYVTGGSSTFTWYLASCNVYEVEVPAVTEYARRGGSNASGTWPINITGSAASATNADTTDGQHLGTTSTPTFAQVYTNDWFRSTGNTGWYNQTHAVGLYAVDGTWIRAYPSGTYFRAQYVYQDGPGGYASSINGTLSAGYVPRADGSYRITNGIMYDNGSSVGIGTTSIFSGAKLHVNGPLSLAAGAYTATLTLGSESGTWLTGISQRDAGWAEMRIWTKSYGSIYFANSFDGSQSATTLPADGMVLKYNKLGLGAWTAAEVPSEKLHVKGNILSTGLVNAGNYLQINSKYAIDGTDAWLRLNQQGSFTNGTYTPYGLRADGGLTAGGYSISGGEVRANFFRDGDSGYYVDPGDGLSAVFAGHLKQGQIVRPVATWASSGGTGAIIIKIPATTGMLQMEVNLYEYSGDNATTYIIGGHNCCSAWHNYGVKKIGTSTKSIRLGYKDGQYCIVIGGVGTTWSYPSVAISKAVLSGVYGAMNMTGTYTITQDNTESYTWISADLSNTAWGNADMTDGLHVHGGRNNEANKIVRTDSNGYIQAGWINTDSGDSGVANRLTRIYSSYDAYLRYSTLGDFKVHMGLSYKNSFSRRIDYTTDSNYWVGSMGQSGYGANETFHGGSGFFDIWSGTNYPPGTSHIHGFNALHYTTNSLGSTGGNAYGIQVAGQYNQGGTLFTRGITGGSFSSWYKIWSEANDGSGSGLDADTTDGQHLGSTSTPTFKILNFYGVGGDSGNASQSYAIYQEGGAWSSPFPDLCIGYHTGIKLGAHYSYNGIRFYNNSDMVTETMSVGNGDNNVRVAYNLYVGGTGTFSGYIYKNGGGFQIDHPLDPANKVLIHSFVESPDMKNLYDGVVVLDENGESVIELPDWFGALNRDFRYQLTPIGKPGMPYVKEEIKDNKFTIAGDPGMKVSWQVTGTRQDAYAEKHRLKVEEEKGTREGMPKKGEYLAKDCYE